MKAASGMPRRGAAGEAARTRFLAQIAADSHFHRVFDGLSDVHFFAKNLAGEVLFFSRGALPHLGLHQDEQVLGKTDDELTPGPFADRAKEEDREVIETRQPLLGMIDVWFDEVGLPDWYEMNKYPIFDRRGDVIGVMGTLRAFRESSPPGSGAARIGRAVSRLRAQVDRLPSVNALARDCGLSLRQLQRSFRNLFGCSPRVFWMKCRIRSACIALRDGRESINAIAQRLGFCDQSNFTQHFRRHMGVTPGMYRKRAERTRMRCQGEGEQGRGHARGVAHGSAP